MQELIDRLSHEADKLFVEDLESHDVETHAFMWPPDKP